MQWINRAGVGWMMVIASLLLLFTACSSDGSSSDPGDGDVDIELENYVDIGGICSTDDDCGTGRVCVDTGEGKYCAVPMCDSSVDCADLGAGCYCQINRCVCPVDGDEDSITDGDNNITDGDKNTESPVLGVDPSQVDFGAVPRQHLVSKEISVFNAGVDILEINATDIIPYQARDDFPDWPDCTERGDTSEFSIREGYSSTNNVKELAPEDSHHITVDYAPDNPGLDCAILLIGSNAGVKYIPLRSQEKGDAVIKVECDDDPTLVPPDQYADACLYGLTPVGEAQLMQVNISNERQNDSDTKSLIITSIRLEDSLNENYEIDQQSIDWNGNGNQVWLSPGETETITMVYQPRNQDEHTATLLITHNDDRDDIENPLRVTFYGIGVVPQMVVQPSPINFGSVSANDCKSVTTLICNRGGADLQVDSAVLRNVTDPETDVFRLDLDPDIDGTENIPDVVSPGLCNPEDEAIAIEVLCCPRGEESYSNFLDIRSNDLAFDNNLMPVPLTCTGTMPDCQISPLDLNFGSVQVGSQKMMTVIVKNPGQATLHIDDAYITGSLNFSLDNTLSLPQEILPRSDALNINVFFLATSQGNFQGELHIIPRDGDCEETVIPLFATAIVPQIQGPTECVTWNDVQVPPADMTGEELEEGGWIEHKQILLTNPGSDTLNIGEIKLPAFFGDEFKIVHPPLPTPIPPGGTFGIDVSYIPDSYGEDNAYIIVCSNASNASGSDFSCNDSTLTPHEICLVGNAISPQLNVTATSTSATITPVGCAARWLNVTYMPDMEPLSTLVTLTNNGTGPVRITDIDMGFAIDEDIYIPEGGIQPPMDEWPETGYELNNGDWITVTVFYKPSADGNDSRTLDIHHNDKDAACLGSDAGDDYPIWYYRFSGSSSGNTDPVAIVKSPPGVPSGQNGTRQIVVNLGEEINLDGWSSYDPDDDPETAVAEDSLTWFEWTVDDTDKVTFTSAVTEGTAQEAGLVSARFDYTGEYKIQLRVRDTRNAWSSTVDLDSQLTVLVQQAPTAKAYAKLCDDPNFSTSMRVEAGTTACFDGSLSSDPDGTISEYRWYVQELGGQSANFAVGSSPSSSYTFTQTGTYYVSLIVVDNEGNLSDPNVDLQEEVTIEVFKDEALKIEMVWSGQGDVDLHFLKPGGYIDTNADCNAANPMPNWGTCGIPQFTQSSSNGIAPEVVEHDNPCDGMYGVAAKFITPLQDCGYVRDCRWFYDDCEICDCDCKPFCLVLRICCNDCEDCVDEYVCEDIAADLTFRVFAGDSQYPTFTVTGSSRVVEHAGDVYQFNLWRQNGEWLNVQ